MNRPSRHIGMTSLKIRLSSPLAIFAAFSFAASFASGTAFMQNSAPGNAQGNEPEQTRTLPVEARPELAPGVALSYPELEIASQQPAEQVQQPSTGDSLFVTRSAQSTAVPPSVVLQPHAAIVCNGAGGVWSSAGTWTGGVPTAADSVTITNGCTVTIDTAANALSVTVQSGGLLQYDVTAQSLTVAQTVTIDAGGTFQTPNSGGVTTQALSVGADLINNGSLNFSTGGNAQGGTITFTGPSNNTFGGTGAVTNIRALTINKGASSASTLELNPTNFSVQGTTVDGAPMAFLTLTNGTLKVSGAFALTGRVFTTAAYAIGPTAGFWLNNPNFAVAGQNGSPSNNGLLRISQGTFLVGTLSGDSMGAGVGASFIIEGGTLSVSGRLNSANAVTYTQSGGFVNVSTAGNTTSSTPSFGFTSILPTNVMTVSGGTINLVQASTAPTPVDYNQQGTINFTGGTLNIGSGATATNFLFRAQGNMPNVVIDNTTNNKTVNLSSTGYAYGNFTIPAGATFNPNAFILNVFGSTFTNNGTITGCLSTSTTSRLQFTGTGAQSYTGIGTVCSAADPLFGFSVINRGGGMTIDPAVNNINAARLLAFSGSVINANKVNLTQVGTNVMVIQRGGVAQLPAGTIDALPSFSAGTTFLILVYSQASNAVSTGPEVPGSRTALSLQEFNTNGVTVAGGPLTLTGTGAAAPNTVGLLLGGTAAGVAGGPLNTTAANIITVASTATGALIGGSEECYVNGPLVRTLPASLVSGSTYTFPIGKSIFKQVELVNPTTNAGGTVNVQAEVFDADSGGTGGTGLDDINHNRYWNVQITSGAANFINGSVRVTELNSTGNALGLSATQGGAYASVGGTLAAATVQSAAAITSLGFFSVGRLTGTVTFPGGTYTIGPAGSYATLTAAMADLANKLITGPVVYSLIPAYTSGGETFPITVPRNGGSNATNTMTIKPAAGATVSISGSSASSMLRINNAFVTVDGSNVNGGTSRDLTIQNTNTATNTAAVWVSSQGQSAGATNATLKNLNIHAGLGGATTNIFGIFAGGAAVATNGDNNASLTIANNVIDTAYEGIAVRAAAVLNGINNGLNINNNTIGSANGANLITFRGIELIGTAAAFINKNEVFNMQNSVTNANIAAVELASTNYYAQVTRNKIHDLVNSNPAQWGAFGVSASTSTNNFSNSIINNAIWGVSTFGFTTITFSAAGIFHSGGAGFKIYDNSVNMFGTATLANSLSTALGIESATASGADVRDNILVNNITGPATHKAYSAHVVTAASFGTAANLGFGTINFNDYYSTGTNNVAGFLNFYGADHTTLPLWRSSTQNDVNSTTADPLFISSTNLDLQNGSPAIGAGQTIAGITTDILGRGRLSPPAIGAYEPNGGPTASTAFISGQITTGSGGPLAGVMVNLTGARVEQTVTDENGRFRFDNLQVNGLYSITPQLPNYVFTPASRSFSLLANTADASFMAATAASRATISGVVTSGTHPLAGVSVTLGGKHAARAITDSQGQFRFSNIETNGFYTVTPDLIDYTFSPASRSFSLVADNTDAVFTGTANSNARGNPITGGDFFVRQQYLDFLGREPDTAGWLFWTEQLQACGIDANCVRQKRIDISAAFFMSDEFQQGGNFVYRVYRAGLGRNLTYNEFNMDRQQVIGGPQLQASRSAFADAFVQRPEFQQKYAGVDSAATFVDTLLQSARTDAGVELGSQREALIAAYGAAADLNHSRSAVLQAVAETSKYQHAVYNSSFVLTEYFGYLRRNADSNGYQFWLEVLNTRDRDNYRGMVCSFVTSAEYQRRFSAVVVNSNAECGQ